MIQLFITLLPSLAVITLIYLILKITFSVKFSSCLKSLFLGALAVIPAYIIINLTTGIIIPLSGVEIPSLAVLFYSALNEEGFKTLFIRLHNRRDVHIPTALFTGAGFALTETVLISMGNSETAVIRAFIPLILHVTTAGLCAMALKKSSLRLFLIPWLLHGVYNALWRFFL